MSIRITGRQFEITPEIKEHVEAKILPLLDDQTLKITSVNVTMDREKSRFATSLCFNCKYHVITSDAADYDLYKSFDAAFQKAEAQLKVLHDKIRSHQVEPLSGSEVRKAEAAGNTEA